MKKFIYLIVLTLILGLVLTGCLLSNVGQVPTSEQSGITYLTKGETTVIPLLAGQDILVGTVNVWNDGINLYVKYVTTGGWEMAETHLAVATSLDSIPHTRTGNPIPGKFEYSTEHDPWLTEYIHEVDLGTWISETLLYIAAHAVVVKDGCYETVWQIGDVEEVNVGTGWLENYADEFNWGDPAGPITMGPSLAVEEPSFTDPFIVGTTLGNQFPYNSNFNRSYAINFDVQWNGSLPFGGLLTISWSPGASGTEKKVVSGDGISSPATFTATGVNIPSMGWFRNKYPLVQHSVIIGPLSKGEHIIHFEQIEGNGTYWDWVKLEKVCEETAWGAGERFIPKGNWATYFTYTIQGGYLAELIPAVNMFPVGAYNNIYQIPGATGKVTVIQPNGNIDVTLSVSVDGLNPNSLHKVSFDKSGITPSVVSTAGPWDTMGYFTTNGDGHGEWSYDSVGTLGTGTYTWSVFINRQDPVNATVLISYNVEFKIE